MILRNILRAERRSSSQCEYFFWELFQQLVRREIRGASESALRLVHQEGITDENCGKRIRAKCAMSTLEPDKQRFETDVTRMMDRLYGAALRFTRNRADAEDLLGDSLAKAWKNYATLQDTDKFDGWVMRIVSNTYISRWRRHQTHQAIFDEDLCTQDLDDTESLYARLHQPFLLWWGTPEQTFVNDLLNEDIEAALGALPESFRLTVVMVEVMGYSYEEVAESMDVPVGTVRSRLNRGRKLLQKSLWEKAREAGIPIDKAGIGVN